MQDKVNDLLKTALINYVKNHNECIGTIMEFADHLGEAVKTFYKLPTNIQNDIGLILVEILIKNGVLPVPLR